MFSALKDGVFEPTIAVEYTDDEVGFGAEGAGGGRVIREEVTQNRRARFCADAATYGFVWYQRLQRSDRR